MKLTKQEQTKIKNWLYGSGRDLDISRLNYHFEDGDPVNILHCISIYQNKDGGFGNGLDNASMNPYSTYTSTAIALQHIIEAGYTKDSKDEVLDYILKRILKYLSNNKEYYYPLTDKKNNKFPGAEYLKHGSKESKYYPTCLILGSVYKLVDSKNVHYIVTKTKIAKLLEEYLTDTLDENELCAMSYLLKQIKNDYDISKQLEKFKEDINKLDTYHKVIVNNNLVELKEEEINTLIENRLKVGLWDVRYDWGNKDPEQEVSELKEISKVAVDNLLILKSYNSLE